MDAFLFIFEGFFKKMFLKNLGLILPFLWVYLFSNLFFRVRLSTSRIRDFIGFFTPSFKSVSSFSYCHTWNQSNLLPKFDTSDSGVNFRMLIFCGAMYRFVGNFNTPSTSMIAVLPLSILFLKFFWHPWSQLRCPQHSQIRINIILIPFFLSLQSVVKFPTAPCPFPLPHLAIDESIFQPRIYFPFFSAFHTKKKSVHFVS